MWKVIFFLLLISPCMADQGIIAKKPYDDEIYVCKKRILYIAVDKTQLTTLESILTKKWIDRVNPKVLATLEIDLPGLFLLVKFNLLELGPLSLS